MVPLAALWLPILVAAVIVFLASSVIHMMTPWHKSDYAPLPNEDAFSSAVRPLDIPPGDYMAPRAGSMKEMGSPQFIERLKQGPNVVMTVLPAGPTNMGRNLGQWFVYLVIVSLFAAYIAGRALGPGTDYLEVFRFVGAVAFVGYAVALWQMSIWWRRSWGTTFRNTVDGLIYALLTAGTFGWLWPK